jgi:hypothetical protein
VRTSLNLSGIFRAIGVRDPRQNLEVVEVVQPTLILGDYSKLGPSVLPPTSTFGAVGAPGAAFSFAHVEAPPNGCWVRWSAFVSNAAKDRQANSLVEWRVIPPGSEQTLAGLITWENFQIGHQPSAAVGTHGNAGKPPGPTYWPVFPSAAAIEYFHFLQGGWFLEVWADPLGEHIGFQAIVEDVPVQPLPDAALASTS